VIEQLIGIAILIGFLGAVGCFVAPFISPKAWSLHNKTTLIRMLERLCP